MPLRTGVKRGIGEGLSSVSDKIFQAIIANNAGEARRLEQAESKSRFEQEFAFEKEKFEATQVADKVKVETEARAKREKFKSTESKYDIGQFGAGLKTGRKRNIKESKQKLLTTLSSRYGGEELIPQDIRDRFELVTSGEFAAPPAMIGMGIQREKFARSEANAVLRVIDKADKAYRDAKGTDYGQRGEAAGNEARIRILREGYEVLNKVGNKEAGVLLRMAGGVEPSGL